MPTKKPFLALSHSGRTRRRYRERGLCNQCGKKTLSGFSRCGLHCVYGTPRPCSQCKKAEVIAPMRICSECSRENRNKAQVKRYEDYKRLGKCRCGEPAREDRNTCADCGREAAARVRRCIQKSREG